jgi:hypothetical protein
LQQKREAQQAEHDRRLRDLEERIAAEIQKVHDAQLAQQRAQVLQQKQEDLRQAQSQSLFASMTTATSTFISSIPTLFSKSTSQSSQAGSPSSGIVGANPDSTTISNSNGKSNNPSLQPPTQPSSTFLSIQRPQTPPGNPATTGKSTPEAEWERQKNVEGANNVHIDAVMDMIGLEDVKKKMLRIKDKIEVFQRQNTSLKHERFNIVLLGNPGTGESKNWI